MRGTVVHRSGARETPVNRSVSTFASIGAAQVIKIYCIIWNFQILYILLINGCQN